MATITPFSSRQILSWRLRIGTLLLLFAAISYQPRTGGLILIADAFAGPKQSSTRQTMMRSTITSQRNRAFLDSRRRLWSVSSSGSFKYNNDSKERLNALPRYQSHEHFSQAKRRNRSFQFGNSRFFSASNAPPLQAISSPVDEESTSNSYFSEPSPAIRIDD